MHVARRLTFVIGLVAAAGFFPGCGGSGDPNAARIEGLRKQGDVAGLAQQVENPDTKVSRQALRALGRLGPQAQPHIENAMRDTRREVREEAALVYPRAAKANTAPPLANLARTDPEPDVRVAAVTALGHMRAVDEIETLLAAVEDPDPVVSQRAVDAIARIMGRRYDFSGTPEHRREIANYVRERWQIEAPFLRKYFHEPLRPKSK